MNKHTTLCKMQPSKMEVVTIGETEKIYTGDVKDYDATFSLPKAILKMVGIRIFLKDTRTKSICWNIYFWINFVNIIISCMLESINMFSMAARGTFVDLFTMMPCVGYLIIGTCKAYKIKRYYYVYKNLVYELRDMWPNGPVTEEEHRIINEALRHIRFIIRAYFSSTVALGSIFTGPPFIAWIKNRAGYDTELLMPFFFWFPFDQFKTGRFEAIYFSQTFLCSIVAGYMLSADLFFCIFLCHITTQFSLLSLRIKKLIYVPIDDQLIESYPLGAYSKEYIGNNQSSQSNDEQQRKLAAELVAIIQRHRALIRLSSDVDNMYTFSLLVNFMNSSVIICFCLFCCAFVEKWNEFIYKMFLITSTLQIWMLCWYGQRLIDTSTGVADSLYNCGWYTAPSKIKKTILIMINRSQKQVHVTTYGFSIISLASYATILKTSWSYFTLLINMYEV